MLPPRLTLYDFLQKNFEPPPCVVDLLLPFGGLSILAAEPKAGKSTLVRNLILCVARGQNWLGRATSQSRVLYYPLEEPESHVGYEFKLLGARHEPVILRAGAISKRDIHTVIETDIAEINPGLVVVDPLFDAVDVEDSNSYGRVNAAMKELLYIARGTGVHILTVHHANKGAGSGINKILGSQAFAGATDCNMLLSVKTGSEGLREFETIQRVGEPIERTNLHFDPDTHWISLGTGVKDQRVDLLQRNLLEALGDEALFMVEWRERVKGRTAEKGEAIRQLHENGLIEQVKDPDATRPRWRRKDQHE